VARSLRDATDGSPRTTATTLRPSRVALATTLKPDFYGFGLGFRRDRLHHGVAGSSLSEPLGVELRDALLFTSVSAYCWHCGLILDFSCSPLGTRSCARRRRNGRPIFAIRAKSCARLQLKICRSSGISAHLGTTNGRLSVIAILPRRDTGRSPVLKGPVPVRS
jgi:hypothetical protein